MTKAIFILPVHCCIKWRITEYYWKYLKMFKKKHKGKIVLIQLGAILLKFGRQTLRLGDDYRMKITFKSRISEPAI